MPLFLASLNSGSNGNCYYVGNREEAVLIDAGLSCKETELRMQRCGLDMGLVKAIFISHEHADHINGLCSIVKKHRVAVYITENTLRNSRIRIDKELIHTFSACEPVTIGALEVLPFGKCHDAADPHSFLVRSKNTTIGIMTDIGIACSDVISHFRHCHAAVLESNYDVEMLANGRYPWVLKKRISGRNGHLSNDEALDLFVKERPSWMSLLILAHLSQHNNRPDLVQQMFEEKAGRTKIVIASRHNETQVFEVAGNGEKVLPVSAIKRKVVPAQVQLSLF